MAFVYKQNKVLREIIQQRHRRAAGGSAADDPGIVLNSGAISQLLNHFNIVIRPLCNALRLNQLALLLEILHPRITFLANLSHCPVHFLPGGHIVTGRINCHVVQNARGGAGNHVDFRNALNFISEKFHANGFVMRVYRENLHGVSPHTEHISLKCNVVSLIANFNQLLHQLFLLFGLAGAQRNDHVCIVNGVTQTVNAGNRRYHYDISPFKQ